MGSDVRGLSIPAAKAIVLEQTSALALSSAANDCLLCSVTILANATTAAQVTIAGFEDEDGDAKDVVLVGNISGTDARAVHFDWPFGLLNSKGALTVTASVADKVVVGYRPV